MLNGLKTHFLTMNWVFEGLKFTGNSLKGFVLCITGQHYSDKAIKLENIVFFTSTDKKRNSVHES